MVCKIIKEIGDILFVNNDILFFDEDSGNVTFSGDERIDLDNINLDDR